MTHPSTSATQQSTPSYEPSEPLSLALDENQLAIRWNLSVQTLRRWRYEQLGPTFCKLGRRITYLLDDIVAFERRVARNVCSVNAGDHNDD